MEQFQNDFNEDEVIWFGTDYYRSQKSSEEDLQDFREAITSLRIGKALGPKQSKTLASHEGVKFDALR